MNKIAIVLILIAILVLISGCTMVNAQSAQGGYKVDGGGYEPARFYYPHENVMCYVSGTGISCVAMPPGFQP